MRRSWIGVIWLLIGYCSIFAQSDRVIVEQITITGNEQTRAATILRELDFAVGDTLPQIELVKVLSRNEKNILNTGLFNDVTLNLKNWRQSHNTLSIEIAVVEAWYLFPVPIIDWADRNFNVWWVEHKASIKRLNYGLKFYHFNLTGRGDKLSFTTQLGYTQKYKLSYSRPYFNAAKNLGYSFEVNFDQQRELEFDSENNKPLFFRDEKEMQFRQLVAYTDWQFRPTYDQYHNLTAGFNGTFVSDSIIDLNPDFFVDGNQQRFLFFAYTYTLDRRDSKFYPIDGVHFIAELRKEGIGLYSDLDKFNLTLEYARYLPITKRLSTGIRLKGRKEFSQDKHPYFGMEALGIGDDVVRGYDYYVIRGTDFLLNRNSLRYNLLTKSVNLGKYMPLDNYKLMPLKMYLSLNADAGYVYAPGYMEGENLDNELLIGGGLGLDIVLYHVYIFRLEYSRNQIGEDGIFFNFQTEF